MAGHEGSPEPWVVSVIGVIVPTEPDTPAETVCWGRRLGCKKPCSENFVPGEDGGAKQFKFCKSCRADLLVPADRARTVPIANKDTYRKKGGQKKGGEGLWKSDTERYRLFNYHSKCWHKDDAIVVWHKEAASSEIAQQCQHGRDIPQEWCTQDDDGTWCLKLKWSTKDFQPVYFEPEKGSKKRKVRQVEGGEDEAGEDVEEDEEDEEDEEEEEYEVDEEDEMSSPRNRPRRTTPKDGLRQRLSALEAADELQDFHTQLRQLEESASHLERRDLPRELHRHISSVRNYIEHEAAQFKQLLDEAARMPAVVLMCGNQVQVIKQGDPRFQQTGEVICVKVEGVTVRFGDASEENFKRESVVKVESAGQSEAPQPDGGAYRSLSSPPSPGGAEPVYRGDASVLGCKGEPGVLTSLAFEEGQSVAEALLAGLEELFVATLPPSLQPAVNALRTMLLG